MLEQEENAKKQLNDELEELLKITPKSLIRTNELGTSLDFSEGTEIFTRTLKLFRDIKDANLDNVPHDRINQLIQSVMEARNSFKKVKEFNPAGQNNPVQVRDTLIQNIASQYQSHFEQVAPIIAYAVRKGTDFEKLEENARKSVGEIEKIKRDQEEKSKVLIAEINDTLEKVRKAAAEVGVAQHAIHFMEEAQAHYKKTWYWLAATILLAVITIGYGVFNIWYYTTKILSVPTPQLVQITISKIIVFSILYFGIIWTGKIYKSHWHNYVVNKHRQNALSSFETFVKATSDDQTKNAVLLQATQSIFSQQNSGFVSQDSEPAASPKILEIIRNIASGTE